jgi:hypothetical protein
MRTEQIKTSRATPVRIMRSPAFRRSVEDKRAGRAPLFDAHEDNAAWDYERGRHWATIAPADMAVLIGKRVNPAALRVFEEGGVI